MRLQIAEGQPKAAVRQYNRLKSLIAAEWGEAPSETANDLAARAEAQTAARPLSRKRHINVESDSGSPAAIPEPSSEIEKAAETKTALIPRPSLPLHPAGFFGREKELAWLMERLTRALSDTNGMDGESPRSVNPLITLTGTAGSGKTRLAMEAFKLMEAAGQQTAWFVSLSEIAEPHLFLPRIHEAIGLVRLPTINPLDQIVEALSRQPSLLILDNLEQLLPDAAAIIHTLLRRAPSLCCLVTSRQTLNLAIEQEYHVDTLPFPDTSLASGPLLACPSVQLFAARALMTRPNFEITRANRQAVAELCSRLEGLPLAIELAAARIHVMSPAQILGRLAQRFTLLVDKRHDTGERHRSLHAALEWSYQLLSLPLRRLFARLSIFRGGWTYEAAMDVCGEPSALGQLTDLRERSLILAEDDGIEVRFRMLDSVREFAAEKMEEGERALTLANHARHYTEIVDNAAAAWWGPEEADSLDQLDRVYENTRAALHWLSDNDVTTALRVSGRLSRYWYVRGLFEEGRRWLDETLARTEDIASPIRVAALTRVGILARDQADYPCAVKRLEEGLALAHSIGDRQGVADALQRLGLVASDQQEYKTAHRHLNEALMLDRALENRAGVALTLACLAALALRRNELEDAAALCCEALAEFRTLRNTWGIVTCLHVLGNVEYHRGNYTHSVTLQQECLEIQRQLGNKRGVALALIALARAMFYTDVPAACRPLLTEALHGFRDIGDKWGAAGGLEVTSRLLLQQGDALRACRMLGAAAALRERIGVPLSRSERPEHDSLITAVRKRLGTSRFNQAFTEGRTFSWDQAVAEAIEIIEPHPI